MIPRCTEVLEVTIKNAKLHITTMDRKTWHRFVEQDEDADDLQRYYWSRGEIDDDCFPD